MANFTFMHPMWFLALVPLLLILPWLKSKKQTTGLIASHLAQKLGIAQPKSASWPIAILALGWLIAVVAMAGPSWQKVKLPAYNLSGARVLVMDMSRSMYATDIKPNRLTQARFKALDMLPGWKEGTTGLVTYAGDGYEVSPLTEDSHTLANLIPSLSPKIMPIPGSNAAAGIAEAIKLLKQAGNSTGDIILITDGMTKQESAQSLAELKGTQYRVSILAMGTVDGAPIPLPDGRLLMDNGSPVISKINLSTLEPIVKQTGGILQMAQPTDQDVNAIVHFTAKPLDNGKKDQQKELQERLNGGFWLVLPLLLLALLGFRRGVVIATMFFFLPIDHAQASPWVNAEQQAYQTYQDGKFKQAAQDFESPQWKGIAEYKAKSYTQAINTLKPLSDPTSRYNLGNAYAQSGQLKQAVETYEKLLKTDPNYPDAQKNLDIVKKALEQQEKQQQQSQGSKDKKQSQDNSQQSQQNQDKQQSSENKQSDDKQSSQSKQNSQQQDQKNENQQQQSQSQQQQNQSDKQQGKEQQQSQQSNSDKLQQDKEKTAEQKAAEQQRADENAKQSAKQQQQQQQQQAEEKSAAKSEQDKNKETNNISQVQMSDQPAKDGDVLSASNPILKKLEQVPDDTSGLIRAQLILQAQQKEAQQKTENSW
ncbi:VWA domain-containing protein [Photobacterium leiognathi]|uniref:VWA domain-containing protein n=1 Tax=Photobacterium leiognathi TaxID=553611 RepID=UPI0029818DD1|nr:VWA domain-containing protein [Photobacterium leiognathi]